MKHQRIQKHLSAYFDNELTSVLRKKVEDHLRVCQECTEMLEDFKVNRERIAELVHPAPSLKNAVLAKIRETENAPQENFLSTLRRWVFRPITVGATALSTVCLVVALYFFTYTPSPQYDELIDFYFGVHTQEVANNPLKSNVATPLNTPVTDTEDFGEETDTLLDIFFQD
ncbi:zf-HC2 domain-containing protein [Candidatus Poribacteria bacterium]|nr:zf-HC2 domain-containing protein [Candidatus Poribacteria bacterium]